MYGYLINTIAPSSACLEKSQAKHKNAYAKLREYLINVLGEPKYIRDTRTDKEKEIDRKASYLKQGASQRLNREKKVLQAAKLATKKINKTHSQAEITNILYTCGKSVGVTIRLSRDLKILNQVFDNESIPNVTFLQSEDKKLQKIVKIFSPPLISKDLSYRAFLELTNMVDTTQARTYKTKLDIAKEIFITEFNKTIIKQIPELELKAKAYSKQDLDKFPNNIQDYIATVLYNKETTNENLERLAEYLSTLIALNLLKEDLQMKRTTYRTIQEFKENKKDTNLKDKLPLAHLLTTAYKGISIFSKEIEREHFTMNNFKDKE